MDSSGDEDSTSSSSSQRSVKSDHAAGSPNATNAQQSNKFNWNNGTSLSQKNPKPKILSQVSVSKVGKKSKRSSSNPKTPPVKKSALRFSKRYGFVDQNGNVVDFKQNLEETQKEQLLRAFNKLTIKKQEVYLPSNEELMNLKNGGMTRQQREHLQKYMLVKEDDPVGTYEYAPLEQPWRPNPFDKNKKVFYRLPMDRLILGKRKLDNVPLPEPPCYKKGLAWLKKVGSTTETMSFPMQQMCRLLLAEDMVAKQLLLKLFLQLTQEIMKAARSKKSSEAIKLVALSREVIEHVYGRHLNIFKTFGDLETKGVALHNKNVLDKKLLEELIKRCWRYPVFKGGFTDQHTTVNPAMIDIVGLPLAVKN